MKRVFFQGTVSLLLFLSTWFALQQVNWVMIFKVEQVTDQTEYKLGQLFLDVFKTTEKENKNPYVVNSIDSIVSHICKANKIDNKTIKIHVLDKNEVNAFALPAGHLIVYSGLLAEADNPEELAGVICHEIAHIELNHIIKKLIKEIGLSALISMTTGGAGTQIINETAKVLSSSAFDRGLEKEADIQAVKYLINAKVDPEPFANFLYRISEKEHQAMRYLSWISTHPDSKERATYLLLAYRKDKHTAFEPVLSIETWKTMKAAIATAGQHAR